MDTLAQAAAIFQAEFDHAAIVAKEKQAIHVRVLPQTFITTGLGFQTVEPKLAFELPESDAHLRLTLKKELEERLKPFTFYSDSRSPDGVCVGGLGIDAGTVLALAVDTAHEHRLNGFSLADLEAKATEEDKIDSLKMSQAQKARARVLAGRAAHSGAQGPGL